MARAGETARHGASWGKLTPVLGYVRMGLFESAFYFIH